MGRLPPDRAGADSGTFRRAWGCTPNSRCPRTSPLRRRPSDASRPTLDGGLADEAHTLVSSLPLGLRRQLAFLCALQHGPDVLVLDEPTSGVEPLARARLWDRIRSQADRGVGVLVTTHYMQEARQCDRLLLMSDGRLVAQGSEQDIVAGTRTMAVHTQDWARVFEVLSAAGMTVNLSGRDVRVIDPDEQQLAAVLAQSGLITTMTEVAPTIEERMTMLARG
jgi:ABC-2 type transport system ATP-binding protein